MSISQLSNMQSRGRSRSSSQSSYKDQRNFKNNVEPSKRLFICGLSIHTDPEDLKAMFSSIGAIDGFFMKKPQEDSKDTFAFINMGSLRQAEQAINALNGKTLCQKMFFVKYAKPRAQKEGGPKPQDRNNFNRAPKGERNNPEDFNRFRGQRERPKWTRNDNQDREFRGNDNKQGFGRQNNYQGGQRNFGNREGNGYQKREEREGRKFEGENRGQGGFNKSEVSYQPPSTTKRAGEDFDY